MLLKPSVTAAPSASAEDTELSRYQVGDVLTDMTMGTPVVELDVSVRVSLDEMVAALYLELADPRDFDMLTAAEVHRLVAFSIAFEGMAAIHVVVKRIRAGRLDPVERVHAARCDSHVREAFGLPAPARPAPVAWPARTPRRRAALVAVTA